MPLTGQCFVAAASGISKRQMMTPFMARTTPHQCIDKPDSSKCSGNVVLVWRKIHETQRQAANKARKGRFCRIDIQALLQPALSFAVRCPRGRKIHAMIPKTDEVAASTAKSQKKE